MNNDLKIESPCFVYVIINIRFNSSKMSIGNLPYEIKDKDKIV